MNIYIYIYIYRCIYALNLYLYHQNHIMGFESTYIPPSSKLTYTLAVIGVGR